MRLREGVRWRGAIEGKGEGERCVVKGKECGALRGNGQVGGGRLRERARWRGAIEGKDRGKRVEVQGKKEREKEKMRKIKIISTHSVRPEKPEKVN